MSSNAACLVNISESSKDDFIHSREIDAGSAYLGDAKPYLLGCSGHTFSPCRVLNKHSQSLAAIPRQRIHKTSIPSDLFQPQPPPSLSSFPFSLLKLIVMASFISASVGALSKELTVQEALSGIFGSVSLATWMFLLVSLGWRI